MSRDIERENDRHFSEQWGNKFRSLDSFGNCDFVKHLLNCTLSKKEDWDNKKCFEGGCGNGRNTMAALQLNVKTIVATDVSKGGVDATIENTKDYDDKVTSYRTSLTKLEREQDNTYDIVFSVNCLPHISNYRDALKEMVRICKKGGLVLFNVPPVRPKLVAEVDRKIRSYSTKMCPECLRLFSEIIVYFANKLEITQALAGKCELSGDLLSAYDHMGLPYTQEFTIEQIKKDMKEFGCEIIEIDERISVKARKL